MVEIVNRIPAGVRRPIQFFHLPVPQPRSDDAYFAPLEGLRLPAGTELYLGLVHHDDDAGNLARLAAARRHARVDGIATECGMARGDPAQFPGLLQAHARLAEHADPSRRRPCNRRGTFAVLQESGNSAIFHPSDRPAKTHSLGRTPDAVPDRPREHARRRHSRAALDAARGNRADRGLGQ